MSTNDSKENLRTTTNKNSNLKKDENSFCENFRGDEFNLNESNQRNDAVKQIDNITNNKINESSNIFMQKTGLTNRGQNPQSISNFELPVQLATAALMAHSIRAHSPNSFARQQFQSATQHQTTHIQPPPQHNFNPFMFSQQTINESTNSLSNQSIDQFQPFPPAFRQQPPPMKVI